MPPYVKRYEHAGRPSLSPEGGVSVRVMVRLPFEMVSEINLKRGEKNMSEYIRNILEKEIKK